MEIFANHGRNNVIKNISHINRNKNRGMPMPTFYLSVLNALAQFNDSILKHPTCYNEVLEQQIWGNKMIMYNGLSLLFRNWIRSGIRKLKDIVVANRFINSTELLTMLNSKINWISELSNV